MHLPRFTAEEAIRKVEVSYQGTGSPSVPQGREGVVMPASLIWCEKACNMDAIELYYDCMVECGGGNFCAIRCGDQRSAYLARCYAECKG